MPRPSTLPRLLIRSSSIHAAGCYTLDAVPRGGRIAEYDGFGAAMFINHSCAPNCETEESDGRIYIRALRAITPNEELLYEYNLYDSDDENCDCFCGAPQCRGTMFSDWELKRRARKAAREKARNSSGRKASA
jgi:hypothetical protein